MTTRILELGWRVKVIQVFVVRRLNALHLHIPRQSRLFIGAKRKERHKWLENETVS